MEGDPHPDPVSGEERELERAGRPGSVLLGSMSRVDDAEAVALGVGEDNVIGIGRPLRPVHLGRAEGEQPLDLGGLVLGVEVEVDARRVPMAGSVEVEGEARTAAIAWPQEHEVLARFVAWHVVERGAPELGLPTEVVDAQHDRSDAQHEQIIRFARAV